MDGAMDVGHGAPALLIFGAHPDDGEYSAGGLAALWAARGGRVLLVSLTNGDAGHQTLGGGTLARLRRDEARAAADVIGAESLVLDHHDGELLPTLDLRREVIALIREFEPDLVLTPRPYDYHPDHRAAATVVQDAAYMVTVPNVVPYATHLARNPVIMYVGDEFEKPYPFSPDVVIAIDDVIETKLDMLDRHASQVYEWLPYNRGNLETVPEGADERRAWLRGEWDGPWRRTADRYRDLLIARYGLERGRQVQYAEAFELCEYGEPLTEETGEWLFLF
jgi:LmbE family N-acetylglucosaminyl deacetylase